LSVQDWPRARRKVRKLHQTPNTSGATSDPDPAAVFGIRESRCGLD
jgi:hypothetical protein